MAHAPIGSKERELMRTAEMLPGIAANQGVYYAVALIHDSGYGLEEIRRLVKILEDHPGARLNGN